MIRCDDLQYEGLRLYQDTALDCMSEDAVLLANYIKGSAKDRIVELGAGNGAVSILAAAKTGARFTGVELQPRQCALARRSAAENGQAIDFLCMDVADAPARLGHGTFCAAVMNPPYFSAGDESENVSRAKARHGGDAALDTFLASAFLLLKNGGRLYMIYPASRLDTLLFALAAHRFAAKRLRIAACDAARAPARILVEARKDGRPGLVWDPLPDPA